VVVESGAAIRQHSAHRGAVIKKMVNILPGGDLSQK